MPRNSKPSSKPSQDFSVPVISEVWNSAQQHLISRDARLGKVIDTIGCCTLGKSPGGFEVLARTIIFQQLSLQAAGTIFGRIKSLVRAKRLTPSNVAALTDEQLRAAGVSRPKIYYLRDLCEKVGSGQISFRNFPRMSDDEIRSALTSVKGLGVWSADMYLIFVMNRTDVLPVLDQGLRNGVCTIYGCPIDDIPWDRYRKRWSPYCSVASWYIWAYKNHVKKSSK